MKTILVSVVLLFMLALGSVICTAVTLQSDVRDVRLEEITHQGDIAAADGLTVVSKNHWRNRAIWTSTHPIGNADAAVTEFDFSARRRYASGNSRADYLVLDNDMPRGVDFTETLDRFGISMGEASSRNFDIVSDEDTFRAFATDPALGIAAAYNALYMDAPLNVEVRATVRLRDYYEYYPISLQLNLPGVIWTHGDLSKDTVAKPGTQAYVVQAFRDYFKIPMLDEVIEIHLTRRNNGMNWGSSDSSTDSYSFYALSAADDQSCYFTFNTKTNRGSGFIDTSEIKGGYGIYRLPYRKSTSTADIGVDVDAMEMVYPLKEGTDIEGLYFNTAKTRLILVTRADDTTAQIDIIDPVSYDCLQTFTVGGAFFRHLKIYEDYTVAVTHDRLMVLTESDGVYTHAFTVNCVTDTEGEPIAVTSAHVTAFDGTRLAVVVNASPQQSYSGRDLCGYDVTVYSADGILWNGTVKNTLDVGLRKNSYTEQDISPFYGEQIAIYWE